MQLFINIIKPGSESQGGPSKAAKRPASIATSSPEGHKPSLRQDALLCLVAGLLYGLSWPVFEEINLSFLAWFAFVPLFVFLKRNQDRFWRSLLGSFGAMLIFALITAGWLFNFPQPKEQVAVIVLLGVAFFTFPIIPFFFLQRRIGFERAIWLFPLLWTVWEWVYLDMEITMGTHMSAYSQSENLWLVQFIDLTGMWGIACWLLLFNVLLYKAYRAANDRLLTKTFLRKALLPAALMLGLPLFYSFFALNKYDEPTGEALSVQLVPTNFSAGFFQQEGSSQRVVEQTLHRTDSLFFTGKELGQKPADLYVWPETGTDLHLGSGNLGELLRSATNDWDAALLTGCRSRPKADTTDWRDYVSGVLVSPRSATPAYHHKTVLTPGQEMIPYHRQLANLPGFKIPLDHPRYRRRGTVSEPLSLDTRNGRNFQLGISLCFEQWYPAHWAALARNGAEANVHMAGEGWYGEVGFQQFMVNVSRLRCIETRRAAARCANVGISGFISATGRLSRYDSNENTPQSLFASAGLTPFARWPNWFPVGCLLVLIGSVVPLFTHQSKKRVMTIFKNLPLLLAFFLLPLFAQEVTAGASSGFIPDFVSSDPTVSQRLRLSRTYLQQRAQLAGCEGIEVVPKPRNLAARKRTVPGNKSSTSVTITYDDFAGHLVLGRNRQVQMLTSLTGIPMDVGGEDVEGLFWEMPNLPAFGSVLFGTITSDDVATSPYVGDFPGATPTHVFNNGAGQYDYYELIADTPTETGALYYYGAADADYVYLGDYVHAPIPLALGLGVFGGEFDPVPCSLLEGGCETGNPDEAYYQIFQEFEEVASGTLQTYDNGNAEALKVRNTVTTVITDVNDNVIEEYYTDYLIWYSKAGHYLRCELADGAPWAGNTSFVSIEYHKLSSTALPVQWQSVTAEVKKDREVEIRWSTESETDNERFIIERSTDGSTFLPLGSVPAAGNSDLPEHYHFTDEMAHEGFNYYRVKQLDFDGGSSYSSVVSVLVTSSGGGEALHVLYPNPGRDEVYVSRPASYELFNAQGQRMASGFAEGSVDVSGLPAGQYLVRLDGGTLHRWVKQ